MTNDDDCVSIDVVACSLSLSLSLSRWVFIVNLCPPPRPAAVTARHSILLISSQNTQHLTTYIAASDSIGCHGARQEGLRRDRPLARQLASSPGELYKSDDDRPQRQQQVQISKSNLLSSCVGMGRAGRINVVRLKWRTALARQVSTGPRRRKTLPACSQIIINLSAVLRDLLGNI